MAVPHYARPTASSLLKAKLPQSSAKAAITASGTCLALTQRQTKIAAFKMKKLKCTTCDRSLPLNSFPKSPEDSACNHKRETCRRCWHQWLDVQVESTSPDQIACAQCPNILGQTEVRALATPAVYQKFLDAEFKATLAAQPDFRWCISPNCKSGQVHSEGDIFRCVGCGFKMCVHCNVEWHEGETCEAFQDRPRVQEEQEKQSAEALKKYAKLCPSCGKKLEKNGGCDHMHCTCGHDFCWICLADHRRIWDLGNSMHKENCRHWRPKPARSAS